MVYNRSHTVLLKKRIFLSSGSQFFSLLIAACEKGPGRVAQLVGHLTHKSEVMGLIPGLATSISPSADSRGAVVSYWQKYVHEVLVNRLGGLSLPRKSVVRLTDHPNMTLVLTMDVKQQQKL